MKHQNAHHIKYAESTLHQPFITRAWNLMSYCNGKVDPISLMNPIPCLVLADYYKKGVINCRKRYDTLDLRQTRILKYVKLAQSNLTDVSCSNENS